jgi:quercetin dioxygenase-like cupin family protein
MSSEENPQKIDFLKAIDYSEKAVVSKKILTAKGGNISLFAFDKEEALSEHTAPFDALVQVLEGEVKIEIDGLAYVLVDGQSIIMPATIPHALTAITRFKILLTMLKK